MGHNVSPERVWEMFQATLDAYEAYVLADQRWDTATVLENGEDEAAALCESALDRYIKAYNDYMAVS